MISVAVTLGADENLVFVEASGHAGKGKPGTDIVCAAVTVLLRTTAGVLTGRGLAAEVKTAGRGTLSVRVTAGTGADVPLLRYAAAFLLEGLGSLAGEYPDAVEMNVLHE